MIGPPNGQYRCDEAAILTKDHEARRRPTRFPGDPQKHSTFDDRFSTHGNNEGRFDWLYMIEK